MGGGDVGEGSGGLGDAASTFDAGWWCAKIAAGPCWDVVLVGV